jgi:hypothetical protein
MSFLDGIGKMASGLLGNFQPADVAQAASDHVSQMDPNELAGHLQQSVGTMDQSSLMTLGQHLLQQCMGGGSGDAAQVTQNAGTTPDAVSSGSPNAISSLIEYCKSNPAVLQAATTALAQRNPEALQQMAPGLISGIMGRLTGHQPQGDQPAQ